MTTKKSDDLDYTAEGSTPPHEKEDPTNAGYDEAAHKGPGRYGVAEGSGGDFGTSGGGTMMRAATRSACSKSSMNFFRSRL